MSFASSSSSASMALCSSIRASRRTFTSMNLTPRPRAMVQSRQISRSYTTDQLPPPSASTSQPPPSIPSQPQSGPSSSRPRPSPSSPPPARPSRGSSNLTASQAQQFLSDLLHLPPSRQFPPKLALQILTHKSYRFTSLPKPHSLSSTPPTQAEETNEATFAASHNARLSFIGRRAFGAYLAMFVHAAVAVSGVPVGQMELVRGKTLAKKLQDLGHVKNVGRSIAPRWGLKGMVRSDGNPNGGDFTIDGMAVEAILGAIYQEFGSPAAHRTFHLMVLPHLSTQLRDPILVERATAILEELKRDTGDSIVI